ncbi:class II fructose-bisphosphate aldolase [Bifidobacterium tibiigranuli]|jgi:fructose-bisphosphate aldolase class II|uniref:class II fructose-bisphosphate aldolase n=1 Tax=Bifidobacterium tibiigranuli TaxID=2172043 RepID=UPI0026F31A4A|nr:class II fructose-bisphosphate aldolase [Bifidobacterium tibiigranuli]MCI1649416.1 class II fructose-bisphosphate aldolase [Bifidobacterium tibiigranuli]MCI2185885.1 class II fructose-bisphosphate aldolase [Bifidobacterium tibiigranuli]MCI2204656.1 class II fructose-bisphosphate aldolase [Bifidobacterium tibiigranuli]
MTIATHERYAQMLDAARRGGYAYPAINVTSTQTLNAALQGFAEAESDGIIQISVGGAAYLSGQSVKDRVVGSLALASFAHEVAAHYPNITVALHTDHCAKQYLDEWVRPLLRHEIDEVAHGQEPTFQSHMWDGSTVPLDENLDIAEELLEQSVKAHTILEIEIGAVGGEEDGHSAEIDEKLYSTPADGVKVAQRLGLGERGLYMAAFTFGNVHGAYKPGIVQLRPELLGDIQHEVAAAVRDGRVSSVPTAFADSATARAGSGASLGTGANTGADTDAANAVAAEKPFALVFHGGSGSRPEEIAQAVSHGVVKMNVDTDTQYAFTRAVAGHMFEHYAGVLKIDGEVGEKRFYDPRSWGREAESSMAARIVEACQQLGSAGKALK